MREVLKAIGYSTAFVSDLSMIGDFSLEDEELKKAEENLGISIDVKDYVFEVALRLKQKVANRK